MKQRLTLITFAVSCLICLAVLRVAANQMFKPLGQQDVIEAQIQVSQTVFNTRYDADQPSVQLTLPIRNSGGKRLIIRTREANCDCFLRKASTIVAPGESEDLLLQFPMHALAYFHQIDLMLVTNDPQQPTVPVTIKVHDSLPGIPANAVSVLE